MLQRYPFGVFLALAALAPPAHAQTSPEWKFKKGAKFFVEVTTTNAQTLEPGGTAKPTTSNTSVTTVSSFEVVDAGADGAQLRQKVEGVSVKADDPTGPSAARAAGVLKGAQFTLTVSPAGRVAKFDGYNDFVRRLTGGNDAAEKQVRAAYPEEAFKEELATIFGVLPDKPAAPGATWKRTESLPLGPLGVLSGEATYTYRGKGDGGEQIDVTRVLTYAAPKEEGNLKLRDVKVREAKGTALFDAANGRLVKEELTVKLEGAVVLKESATATTTINVKQTTTRTFRVLEKNPQE